MPLCTTSRLITEQIFGSTQHHTNMLDDHLQSVISTTERTLCHMKFIDLDYPPITEIGGNIVQTTIGA